MPGGCAQPNNTSGDHVSGALGAYFRFALAESKDSRLGGAGVLSRISELMFVEAVRRYLEGPPVGHSTRLAGLRDPPRCAWGTASAGDG